MDMFLDVSVSPPLFEVVWSNTRNLPLKQGCQQFLPKRDRKELRNRCDRSKEWEQAVDLGALFSFGGDPVTVPASPAPLSPSLPLLRGSCKLTLAGRERTCMQRELCKLCDGVPPLLFVVTITPCVYQQRELCSAGCSPVIFPGALRTKMGIFPCVITRELCERSYFNHLTKAE